MGDKNAADMSERLLAWFEREGREPPWRQERTPYRVWLAAVLLQQTRLETTLPYYECFLERFPTLTALAEAPLEDVLRLWEGLGYYARARHLHDAARQVQHQYDGQLPADYEALRALPGVGPYTAGAVASIAFGQPVVAVDGNARRVLARLFAVEGDPRTPAVRGELEALARALLPAGRPGAFNEALMELGALVCLPRAPRCAACPLADLCQAHRQGRQAGIPRRAPRRPLPHYDVAAAVLVRADGRVLVARRNLDDFLGGLWEFPGGKREEHESLEQCLARELAEELDIQVEVGERLLTLQHSYTHFRITLYAFRCRLLAGEPRCLDCAEVRWATAAELEALPMAVTDRRIARQLGGRGQGEGG